MKARALERRCFVAKKGAKGPILRDKRPFRKVTSKVGANIGAITGILLNQKTSLTPYHPYLKKNECV
jgi:hypothetical protein